MAEEQKKGEVVPFKATPKHPIRSLFVSHNGNPENGDYAEYFRSLCADSGVVDFPEKDKK